MTAASDQSAHPARFYTDVAVEPHADGGFAVLLDARPIKTPDRALLRAPTQAVADLIAAEWARQGDRLDLLSMHVTRLANVAIDRTPGLRTEVAEATAAYAATDLVCHLAPDEPELSARQEAAFAPLRAWAGEALGVALTPTHALAPPPLPETSLAAAHEALLALDDFGLTAAAHAAGLLGSVVLALALAHGRIDAETAFAAYRIDEVWQEERWGVDEEAARATADRRADVVATAALLAALR